MQRRECITGRGLLSERFWIAAAMCSASVVDTRAGESASPAIS
jgi:hypothetical protein